MTDTLTFDMLGLSPELNHALEKMKYTTPSPIQAEAIPFLLQGRDIIGQAQTGTGKTAAFAIPLIETVDVANRQVQAIVICPTRELAMQVADEFRKLAKYKANLSIVCVYGGQPMERQMLALQNQPQILIGTPGRMLDFLWRGTFHLNAVKTVVLDEADEMLNMGFRDDIEKIFGFVPTPRQTVLFSATMPKPILELTRNYQTNPEWIKIAPQPQEVRQIAQSYLEVPQKAKPDALANLLVQHQLTLALVFCNTKRQVDFLVDTLKRRGFAVDGLHGGKAQNQRERILGRFRKGITQILVATDVAARGIDVRDVQAVVNYDLPEDVENYIHRIGRTGRAGRSGQAFSLVARHQAEILAQLQKNQSNAIVRQVPVSGSVPIMEAVVSSSSATSSVTAAPDKPKRRRRPRRKSGTAGNSESQGRSGVVVSG